MTPLRQDAVTEAQLAGKVAALAGYVTAHDDLGLYVRIGGQTRTNIRKIVRKYNGELLMLRHYGPFPWNLIALFIAGHEAWIRMTQPERLPELYHDALKDDMIVSLCAFPRHNESGFIGLYKQKPMIHLDSSMFGHAPRGVILEYVFTDTDIEEEVVCWSYAGTEANLTFSLPINLS